MTHQEKRTESVTAKLTPSEKARFTSVVESGAFNQAALLRRLILAWMDGMHTVSTNWPAGGTYTTNTAGQFELWTGSPSDHPGDDTGPVPVEGV
jgi:hypothetical protein